jgi:hypothetical protein
MENQDIDINNQIEHIQQTGGFVQSIPGALMSVLRAIIGVFKFIFKLIIFIIRTLYPYIIKYLGFCIIVSILLTLFGFFGIFFTFCAIFLIYYKLFKKIKEGNLKFAEEYHKKVSGQSSASYEKSGLQDTAKSVGKAATKVKNLFKGKTKGQKYQELLGIPKPGAPVQNV